MVGRLAQPEEIGRVVRFLLSDEASFITAEHIVVDRGCGSRTALSSFLKRFQADTNCSLAFNVSIG